MRKVVLAAMSAGALLGSAGCEPKVRNCDITGASPSSNLYNLEYKLLIPADCPIPLANPGAEKKRAAGQIMDLGTADLQWASLEITNSNGKVVGHNVAPFLAASGFTVARVQDDYVAATGARTFSDYDIATFRAWHLTNGKNATGKTRLVYRKSDLSAQVAGEMVPQPNGTHTWTAPVSGGYPGFTYQWYRDGNSVGTGASYTGPVYTADFDLRVEVTDQTWSTVAAVMAVDVGGILASIAGPDYVERGDGSQWTATARGGSGAYTFEWYLDDVWVGDGPVWDGYPGDGLHRLRVDVRDATGVYDSHVLHVSGRTICAGCPV